ncbi:hypothetical protein IM660_08305 [Ruania alkalisoli]|uniref:Tetratricopeptide repeat protein n=1 Tax=Ruania alkalisoli TaxID=2779775 RepID=A0A7M1SXA1_9MICO|nr:hypothetical protein [Ruania alkalisoli]QOR72216.1 hypothetical protein IM660_08305 [Ruania alkalisoli]
MGEGRSGDGWRARDDRRGSGERPGRSSGQHRSRDRDGARGSSAGSDLRRRRPPVGREEERPRQEDRPQDPPLAESVTPDQLDRSARSRLRTLSKDNADRVARHLVTAGLLLDEDPERAYQHAHAALRRAGRVDVVREAVALAAYATGRYAEALREVRTVRRLSGVDGLRAIEADCERGLGRPERALNLASAPPSPAMSAEDRVELAIVASGARLDLGQPEAALLLLEQAEAASATGPLGERVSEARVVVLRALGRVAEADELEGLLPVREESDGDVAFGEVELSAAEIEALAASSSASRDEDESTASEKDANS